MFVTSTMPDQIVWTDILTALSHGRKLSYQNLVLVLDKTDLGDTLKIMMEEEIVKMDGAGKYYRPNIEKFNRHHFKQNVARSPD